MYEMISHTKNNKQIPENQLYRSKINFCNLKIFISLQSTILTEIVNWRKIFPSRFNIEKEFEHFCIVLLHYSVIHKG